MNRGILTKGRIGIMPYVIGTVIAVIAVAVIVLVTMIVRSSQNTYRVDYCNQKDCYTNAKNSYKAGELVELNFDLVATDTNYYFYLDGGAEKLEVQGTGNGYILRFIMPAHDVRLEYTMRNTMEYVP